MMIIKNEKKTRQAYAIVACSDFCQIFKTAS